jgi:AcrR family transcriptional regulator
MPETKIRILDAAARAFAARGFHRATIRQIAADAGVNEVTVFRYFPEKAALYWAAVERKVRASKLISLLDDAVESSRRPADLVRSTSSCVARLLREDNDLARLVHFTFLELDIEKRLLWNGLLRPLLDTVSSKLQIWISDGQMRNVDPETATRALLGHAISQHLVGTLDDLDRTLPVEKRASEDADISLFGLLPR